MSKKITVSVLAILLVCTCLFAGCSQKGEYVNPATGKEYDLVTDADGNKVLSEDGELLVYAKDENGKYITDENGEKVTQVHGFIGQLEEDGVIEDYAYKLKIPDGWKSDGNGKFKNEKETVEVSVSVIKRTFAKENEVNGKIAEELIKAGNDCVFEGTHFDAADADGKILKLKSEEMNFSIATFMKEGNLFRVHVIASDVNADVDSILNTFLSALTFKPYKCYEDYELEDVTGTVVDDMLVSEASEESTTSEAE